MLVQIKAPHFTAGIVFNENDRVIDAAPILSYMIGWEAKSVRHYVEKRRWRAIIVPQKESA